jgi:hypothetical protein
MSKKYFKHRKKFDFTPHPFDIGNHFGSWQVYEDNHFLNKLFEISIDQYKSFHDYHLKYAIYNMVCK